MRTSQALKSQSALARNAKSRNAFKSNGWKIGLGAALTLGTLAGTGVLDALPAQAQTRRQTQGIEPWPGRRVLLLLPLQLGEGFNADQTFGRLILARAEASLAEQLQKTGKFSVIRAHNFSPLIQRALQEKRVTPAQVEEALKEPTTLESATALLNQFTFDQVPMIADFRLEEVRSGGTATQPSVQAQVSGRLYELNNPVAIKAPVITSNSVRLGRNNIDRYLGAATNSFAQIATELTAPIEDVVLPRIEPAPAPATAPETATPPATDATPVAPEPTPVPAPAPVSSNPQLPGDVAIAGSSSRDASTIPQLPSARPPLGITVPNAPAGR